MKKRKKRNLVNIVLLIAIFFIGVYIFRQGTENKNISLNNYSGQIEYEEGIVERKIGDDTWKSITKGEIINTGDEIRTLSNSRVIITFEDGSILKLGKNTDAIINELRRDSINILLKNGITFNKVSKNEIREYSVYTEDYRIIALGTEFSVEKAEDFTTKVMVIESEVEITNNTGDSIEMVETGKKVSIKNGEVKKTKISLNDRKNDFISWSLYSDDNIEKIKEEKSSKNENVENNNINKPKISIWGEKTDSGVKLNWSIGGDLDISKGFKLVKSKEIDPVYPGDDYKYISDSDKRSYNWNITTGEGYYFRVCQYLDGKCGVYSKNLYLKTPFINNNNLAVENINLSIESIEDNAIKLKWTVDGDSSKGFKLVYSKNINPEYPTRPGDKYKYLSDSNIRSYKLSDRFESDVKYYFRVCEYLGGKCGKYSNSVSNIFTGDSDNSGDEETENYATNISLSVNNINDLISLNWIISGGDSPKGFKLVYSKNSNPEYPTRPGDTYKYLSDSSVRSFDFQASNFEQGETYHFRVCVYKGGVCGAYSNDVSLTF